ncbi:MAG: histidine kinase [Leptolyngbya sp. SIOISBB]|nr:histidine kinase [Leptolyngbya sp. SIOISBB]
MYLPSPTITNIAEAIAELGPQPHEVVLILMGESASVNIDGLIIHLKGLNVNFVGGVFPAVMSSETHSEAGVVLKVLPAATPPHLIRGLDQAIELPDLDAELTLADDTQLTTLVLIDGLTHQIGTFLAELYDHLGNAVRYLGGGAGSLSLQQQPCIFTAEGCFQDAAILLFTPLESRLGVRHGWQRLQGPMPATQTQHNTIVELNWQNAFDVYQGVVEADSQQSLTPENFFDIAKGYPFGLFKEGQEDIVRDPILVNEKQELVCVGEVPENALLYILRGEPESLVDSARQAASEALQGASNRLQDVLVVDCISRVLFLGDRFPEELQALQENVSDLPDKIAFEGVLTLGEISSYGEGFLEFFNKTIVVGALYQTP